MKNLAVFASGNGSNFQAMIDDGIARDVSIKLLVCDKEDAYAINRAKKAGIETFVFNTKRYSSKEEYEKLILDKLKASSIDFIALAGYMRLIGDVLLSNYENRIINIHPSLLPDFKGKDAIGQAIKARAKVMGVSIHFVDAGMDTGKIIAQESFDLKEGMFEHEIESRIHSIEHKLYPKILKQLLSNI